VGEHAVGELAAELERARPFRRFRQRRARADRLPAREKNRREAVELGPERILAACRRIELSGECRGDAKLGRAPVLRNVEVTTTRRGSLDRPKF
jgi:hypothetical protein